MVETQEKIILIIEDNPAFLKVIKMRLEAGGYKVITAEDGLKGFNFAKIKKPDLIISDLMLPYMDGHKICRFLKFDQNFKNIPFVMLTSRDTDRDRKLARECGADSFFIKTIDLSILIESIGELV